jgi:hypothetical protein
METFYIVILLVSVVIGFINTLVGGGSLVMLPLLMAMGLPANVANGTNRVAVFFQTAVGSITLMRSKKIPIGNAWWSIIPCVLGALVGAYLATQLDPKSLEDFIGILLIVMLLVILVNPNRWFVEQNSTGEQSKKPLAILIMFVIGIYGGFIQGGVGIFLLAGLVLGVKYSLGYANAIKLIIVLAYAFPVLMIFVWQNQVDWFLGLFTAFGQSIGAYIGAKFVVFYPNADLWTYRLLVLVILSSIIFFYKLWEFIGL